MGKVLPLVVVAVLIVGCGAGGAPHRLVSCIAKPGYGGLGARTNLFDANNNNSTGPAEPTPGAAWYQVIGVTGGCVSAYEVQDSAAPPLNAHDMVDLVSPYLPDDAKQVIERGSCAIWSSAALRRALGLPYAEANAIPQLGSLRSGSAQMKATSAPRC